MATGTGPHVVVVGAGIIGAVSAWHLQRSGARVTVLDAGQPGATGASFGWINASFYLDTAHHRFRVAGLTAWRDLARQVALPLTWPGSLCWEETGAAFDAQSEALTALGYAHDTLDAAGFAQLEPHVANPPDRCLHFAQEGAAESAAVAACLLRDAAAHGARLLRAMPCERVCLSGGKATGVVTGAGTIAADHVLIAAGTGSAGLMSDIGARLPMLHRPALILKTRPVAPLIRHILVSRLGELRQLPCGALLMPTSVGHQGDASETLARAAPDMASDALARLQAMFPEVPLDWAEVTLAHRPVPQDGLPVIGTVLPGLSVAVLHSGITLGAVTGAMMAREILDGPDPQDQGRLAPYRPGRFAA